MNFTAFLRLKIEIRFLIGKHGYPERANKIISLKITESTVFKIIINTSSKQKIHGM